jgi:tellurite resistance protein
MVNWSIKRRSSATGSLLPPQSHRWHIPQVPPTFFSVVLGIAGLSNAWRVGHRVWGLSTAIGESIAFCAVMVWLGLLCLYGLTWLLARPRALQDLRDPTSGNFGGLIGVATLLVAGIILPYSRSISLLLAGIGGTFTLLFAIFQTAALWRSDRTPELTTAGLYLPTVAGLFVSGSTAAILGFEDVGQLCFGAGLFSWLGIESVLLNRLYTGAGIPKGLRPGLGIQYAPPAVGALTYISITSGPPDLFARALVGYGLLQMLVVARLFPWIRQQPFSPACWGFTFGAASLATSSLLMIERGERSVLLVLAPCLFVAANLIIAIITFRTLGLIARWLVAAPAQD